jgi:hypothetical protein
MSHDERLPDMRFGAGMLTCLEDEESLVLPVRDAGAPSQSKRLDGQMGIKEKDESVEDAQAREGTEETVFVREEGGETEIGVPETIRGTELEHNLVRTYRNARRDRESPLPEADGVFYFEASQEVGEGMPTTEAEDGGYETGYTWEVTDDVSQELMNDHIVDIDREEILGGDVSVYDLEYMETDDGVTHFDRPTALLDPLDDEIAVFRGGELQYHGAVSGFGDFLEEEYGWEIKDDENLDALATAKVQARLDAYGDELGDESYEEFLNEDYMEAVSSLGDAFRGFPSP